jgi:predicted cation transporter
MITGLWLILGLVLILPFSIKKIEAELELFLFGMGAVAVTVTGQWHWSLVAEALVEPWKITLAVLAAGLGFRLLQKTLDRHLGRLVANLSFPGFAFAMTLLLGLLSSMITAIVAALILVEIISYLRLDRRTEIKLVIITCFAIGMGAALTPIGEPLSTLAVVKLRGAPHYADFWFLARHFLIYIGPGVLLLAGWAAWTVARDRGRGPGLQEKRRENLRDILIRTAKVYVFIIALIFLGTGFKPLIDLYISRIPPAGLFWINSISAVLDNATLVAAEIGPSLTLAQIKFAILGLIISGGILIPGNIPNIISAGKLGIKSREWAQYGFPLGVVLMVVFYLVLILGI